MSTRWFTKIGGHEEGPLSALELRQLVAQGQLRGSDLVRKGSMTQWVIASKVKGLFNDSVDAGANQTPRQQWYTRIANRELGPFDSRQLVALVQRQQVQPQDFVRRGESGSWHPVSEVRGLAKHLSSTTIQGPSAEASEDLIRFVCPKCQHKLKSPSRHAGIQASCPKCRTRLQIPAAPQSPSNAPVPFNKTDSPSASPDVPPEIAPFRQSTRRSVPIRNPMSAVLQRANKWVNHAAQAWNQAIAETKPIRQSTRPPTDRIEFYGPGDEVDLGIVVLRSPLIYATRKKYGGSVDASVIELPCPIARNLDARPPSLPYWPSYHDATPGQRAAYLLWLAGGRADPEVEIGYVFLYFYGLERRVLVDGSDYDVIIQELIRLLSIYDSSRSFATYASALLWLTIFLSSKQGELDPELLESAVQATRKWSQESLRYCLAHFVQQGRPLPAVVAAIVAEFDERTPSSVVVRRHPDKFCALFEERLAAEFPEGLCLKASRRATKVSYRPGSPTLLGQGTFRTTSGQLVPDALALRSQFKPLVALWSACIDELRKFDRASRGVSGVELTAEMYEALPPELQTEDHPETNAWQELITERLDESGWPMVTVSELAAIKGFDYRAKLTKKQCQQLLTTADCIGLAIEPDSRLTNKNYQWEETVVVYHDEPDAGVAEPDAYLSAAMLLRLGLTIAAADDQLDAAELDLIAEHLEERFELSQSHSKRLEALKRLLVTEQAITATLPSSLKKSLALPERRLIGQFLVSVAAADQWISDPEFKALQRAFRGLGLNESELDELMRSPDVDTVHTQSHDAVPHPPNGSSNGHALNLDRIRQIRAETARVQELLHQAMASDDLCEDSEVHESLPMATAISAESHAIAREASTATERGVATNSDVSPDESWLEAIPARFRAFLHEIVGRKAWSMAEVQDVAHRHGVMPSAAIEVANEWSQEQFDDWLIEESGDCVRVYLELLPNSRRESDAEDRD